ncbi:hypothetical protein SLS62_002059 [Diatrype stigma]|uniref:VWFA domain-containing protein n=1 Tax=Diatrype stigma TaxID=117547 RepID=A0AAN9V749_9PEZI
MHSRIVISSPGDKTNPFKLHHRKHHDSHHQQSLHINNPAAHWVETYDAGIPDQHLSPDDAVAATTPTAERRSRSRLSLSRLFPSSSPSRQRRSPSAASSRTSGSGDNAVSPSSPHLSPVFGPSLGGPFSRRRRSNSSAARDDNWGQQQEAAEAIEGDERRSYRSPIANRSPPTRRPRQPSPPPAYSDRATAESGPTLGALPPYETGDGARAPEPAPAPVAAEAGSNSSSRNNSGRVRGRGQQRTDRKDPLAFLSQFDTIFLIDDSMSMWGSSWSEAETALAAIAPVCTAYDEDGVDVYFLDHQSGERDDAARGSAGTGYRHVRSAAQVAALFRSVQEPMGGMTLTGMRLQRILQTYLQNYEQRVREAGGDTMCVKPVNIIVVTDGAPTDEPGDVIRQVARRLDRLGAPPYQVGIQFFQVGDDRDASTALRQLDEGLRHHSESGEELRDIVDTVTFDGTASGRGGGPTLTTDGILKTVLGAVNRRYDQMDLNAGKEQPG